MHSPLVMELIAARATAGPDSLALIANEEQLTYSELQNQSNRLAHYLQSLGVGPDVRVGLCLDRSPRMVVAALAVLKAGGAYVPLDPDHPIERLTFMLRDAQIHSLITRHEIAKRVPVGDWKVVSLDRDSAEIASKPETPLRPAVAGENLAYVIYTSGSTGRPKGVQITHRGLANLISWHQRAFDVSPQDRASQVATLEFDGAVWEIWPNLASGSSIHFPNEATRLSAEFLRDWLIEERITISFAPTPMAEALMKLSWPKQAPLRILLTGGAALHSYPPAGLPFTLVNNYGPTESTVVVTSAAVAPNAHATEPPPIGRPIDNFEVHILDEGMKPVPSGEVGELHIAGPGLARGYINRPELDAEKFISNPFNPSERLYKTGDLVRCLPDGQIAFVGRIDDQIKIRGYRVEPQEITSVLNRHQDVHASCVVAGNGNNGDVRLIAYIVPATDRKFNYAMLQAYLRQYLPEYMIPGTFVQIAELPIGKSGKVDRALLPQPSPDNTIGDVPVLPSTKVEQRVVSILSELLGLKQIGVNENFFFLGGHSLLGTQLIARIRDSFDVELSLRTVFDSPTAAELSAKIEDAVRNHAAAAD